MRLLYDRLGSIGIDMQRLAALREAGGRVEPFLPLNPLRRRWAINLRNHRKLIVVDGEIGFTGGMNVGDEYSGRIGARLTRQVKGQVQRSFGSARALASGRRGGDAGGCDTGAAAAAAAPAADAPATHGFRDTHMKICGPAVADLAQIFAEDWSFATDEELTLPPPPAPRAAEGEVVSIVPSGPDQEHNASGLVYFSGVATARRRVWLTSAYFVPDQSMVSALLSAALRGVDVRVLVPHKSDVALVDAAGAQQLPCAAARRRAHLPVPALGAARQDHGRGRHLGHGRLGQPRRPQLQAQLRARRAGAGPALRRSTWRRASSATSSRAAR